MLARTEAMLTTYRSAGLSGVVQEASPHRLIQLLLDGACSRLAVARGALAAHDPAQKGRLIGEAIGILSALRGTLDLRAGGEIAAALDALYDYMIRRLLEASAHGETEPLVEADSLLREIKSAWEAIPADRRSGAALAGAAA